jgi:hypothetical protein
MFSPQFNFSTYLKQKACLFPKRMIYAFNKFEIGALNMLNRILKTKRAPNFDLLWP